MVGSESYFGKSIWIWTNSNLQHFFKYTVSNRIRIRDSRRIRPETANLNSFDWIRTLNPAYFLFVFRFEQRKDEKFSCNSKKNLGPRVLTYKWWDS